MSLFSNNLGKYSDSYISDTVSEGKSPSRPSFQRGHHLLTTGEWKCLSEALKLDVRGLRYRLLFREQIGVFFRFP